jgi:hypothetical protein
MMVFVLGVPYAIKIEKDPEGFSESQLGYVNNLDCVITLRDGVSEWEKRETALHELIHAAEIKLGLKLKEQQVQSLSAVLYSVLTDNGNSDFVDWLLHV